MGYDAAYKCTHVSDDRKMCQLYEPKLKLVTYPIGIVLGTSKKSGSDFVMGYDVAYTCTHISDDKKICQLFEPKSINNCVGNVERKLFQNNDFAAFSFSHQLIFSLFEGTAFPCFVFESKRTSSRVESNYSGLGCVVLAWFGTRQN